MSSNSSSFETMLTGGHPNSLGNTIAVVEAVLRDPSRLDELYQCYFSNDEVVRLRTSNAFKRICAEHPDWLVPYLDRFLAEVATIDQASTQWTLAHLWSQLESFMNESQRTQAQEHLKHTLANHHDWIVLNNTMQTLSDWASEDPSLRAWLLPHLERLSEDTRKSVANRAKKLLKKHRT